MATVTAGTSFIKSGEEYKESLRDGREVWYDGERVEDVTKHPAFAGGIDILADMYDDQLREDTRDVTTYVRGDGARIGMGFVIPRSPEDLRARGECAEHYFRKTFGVFGRQIDMIPTVDVGVYWLLPELRIHDPERAENNVTYISWAQENNVMQAAPVADPQGFRSRGSALGRRGTVLFSDERGDQPYNVEADFLIVEDGKRIANSLRVIHEDDDGIVISGAKVVGSVAPQVQEITVSNLTIPDPVPESAIYCRVPANAPGVKMICREKVTDLSWSVVDHPLDARGEEMDCLVIYEEVFVPWWRVATYRWTEFGPCYTRFGALEWWHTMTRLCVKAELFVGLLQSIIDAIGTGHRPGVRALAAEVIEYAEILRGMVIAAEAGAKYNDDGVLFPDVMKTTAGRLYAVNKYPSIIHRMQELAGQGPILRWSEKTMNHPQLGPRLEWIFEGAGMPAREKNLFMNLLWDLTSSSHAGRVEIFENVNGAPPPVLQERLYNEYPRKKHQNDVRRFLGLDDLE
jgi:4-hydroxyphenylacetate 3-monooxygenase